MKKILFITLSILLFSCQKESKSSFDNVRDEKLILALKEAYNFSTFDHEPTPLQKSIITETLSESPNYKTVFPKINLNSMRIYENKDENTTIAMFNFVNSSDKLFSIKGYFSNKNFIITNDFLYGRILEDKENGKIIITNNNDAILINVANGIQSYSTIESQSVEFKAFQMKDCMGNHGGTGFCQRQPGERFSTCYKAEKDEFCDSFVSCLAVDLLPPVMILIAAACSCIATPC
jgi:hypothetical protein